MSIRWRILIIEDDQAMALGLNINLDAEGYEVFHAASAEKGIDLLEDMSFDLVVLDLMLPGMDGVEALRHIRKDDPRLPVLILTAKSNASDKVEGLRAGADDYLTKPFHLEEFLLRIRRMLDRYEWYRTGEIQKIGGTVLDFSTLEIAREDGATSRITPHEANLIQYLVSHQDRIVTRGELLKNVWGLDPDIETRTVDTFISRVRRYIEEDPSRPRHIISIRGKGYRFMA
ncbi:MAG: response regulator transcription factor [Desulfomonilia bacterium]|jgi:DNA-binding response OmpR family regulator|nr:response regulator transcription factor [Deltaproteobacteria bacterium]MDX9761904.1 response regulator transcription factor [Desulfomonilia bacterium]HPW68712.1 response regulator transcription factor [Deltaproteobacteria bacterium]